jgi:CRISPR/Cas system-associated protein endoribonuclease Cas2
MATTEACIARLRYDIPQRAQLAFFLVTDKQYAMTREYFGECSVRKKPEAPEQIELF